MLEEVNVTGSDYKSTAPWKHMGEEERNLFLESRKDNPSLDIYDWYSSDFERYMKNL